MQPQNLVSWRQQKVIILRVNISTTIYTVPQNVSTLMDPTLNFLMLARNESTVPQASDTTNILAIAVGASKLDGVWTFLSLNFPFGCPY